MRHHVPTKRVTIHATDALVALRAMPDASVDAIVTDPPYGLSNTTPDKVADAIWAAVARDAGEWTSEVPYSG